MLNFCGIVATILKMASGRNITMSGIISGHHNLPTYEMALKSDNVEFVRYCCGHCNISTARHFQNGRHNTAKIQHYSISKVAINKKNLDRLSVSGLGDFMTYFVHNMSPLF
jgi:hypothetical protein